MELNKQNILFLTRTMKLGGTENVILQLCEILQPRVNKIVVCSCGGVNVDVLHKMGIKHYTIPDIESKTLKSVASVCRTLNAIVNKEDITIIHTHHRMAALYVHILNCKYNVKVICSVHGEFYNKKLLTRISYGNSCLVACGNKVRDNLVGWFGIKNNRIVVIRNSIKKENYYDSIEEIRTIREKNPKCFIVGYIGRISLEKGVDAFVKSLAEVMKVDKNVFYVVAGNGELLDDMTTLADKMKVNNNIVFLGYRKDPQNVIQQVDAVVLCSYTEGLPLTPIEAFAHGKPVIATPVGGTVEIVKNKQNGILVTPGNISEISEAVLSLTYDKENYMCLSKNAEESFCKQFSYEAFSTQVIDLYESI